MKRPKNHLHGIRKISPCKAQEKNIVNPDPMKLSKKEIPRVVLQKIDKMIRNKIKEINPEFIKKLKTYTIQNQNNDEV